MKTPRADLFAASQYTYYNLMATKTKTDDRMVNHPDHYQGNGLEVIDVIDAFGLGFSLGNAVKYILRCGKKDDPIRELRKAAWYIEHEINARSEKSRS